jgi:excisionase family DNA binding protein
MKAKREIPDSKKLLSTAQVAEMLGVSNRSVYRMASLGKLKPVKLGWTTRYRPADVERLMDQGYRV